MRIKNQYTVHEIDFVLTEEKGFCFWVSAGGGGVYIPDLPANTYWPIKWNRKYKLIR